MSILIVVVEHAELLLGELGDAVGQGFFTFVGSVVKVERDFTVQGQNDSGIGWADHGC